MSLNQSRAERKESHYRRPARPGISAHQRVSSGGVGKGGGGTGLPPASANSQSSSFSTTRSFKKTNGQGTQPRVTGTNANLESSAVHNGARAQPMLPGASNALFTNASAKPIDMHNQKSQQTASSAPNSASASGTSESAAPTTPVRADASKGVSLQFGSFSPNIVSGLQIPARTSSAPPNLDEQKRDQARHDSFGSVPLLPTSSISNRQQSREDVEQSKSRVPHHPSHDKTGVRAQAPAYSGATSAKSSSTPVSGASMAIPFQQSQVVQFGVPTPKIQAQGMATTSLQMPILGHSSQVQQQVFVPSIQAPPLQPQGMMRQGQGLNYPPQVGHQVSSQMGNLVIGMGSHFAQQQPGKLGAPRVSIKITDPKTHEELRLDKRADTDLNGGLFGHGSHANMPLQPQPVVYGPSHQVNYFSHIHPNSVFFQNPASLSLTSTTQMAPNSQASVGGQGSHVLAFKNPSLLNHSPAYKTGPPMHGVAVSSNLEHGHGAETLISAASSVSEQVAVKPAALSNEDTVGPPSVSVSSNADNRSEATKLSRPHNATESLVSQGDSKIHMEISVQLSKSISVLSSPRRTETVRRIDSMEDQSKKPWKKDQHHFQMQQQANTLDSADHLAMKAYKEVAKFTENMLASSEKVEPSTSVLEDPSSGLEHVTSAGNRIPETVESEATPASSETCRDVAVSPGEALPGGVACVPVVEGCVCETSNKSSVEIVFDEFNGVSSAKQDNCTSLDIQLKNENTGLAEHMKTEQSEYPQLDNNYNDDKVNIPSVLSSNTSADCKNVDITPSVFCNKDVTVETEQNMLEGASGCGSIVNEKTDNNIERSTAFANGSDSNVGSHFIVSSSSELRTSTLRGSKGESGLMDGQEASPLESGLAHEDTADVPIPSVSDAVLKVEEKVSEEVSDDLVQFSSSGLNDNKHTMELNKVKSTTAKAKKKRKEFLQKAELAGTTSDLYMAYKGPEEKPQPSVSSESVDGNSGISTRQPHSGSNEEDIASKEDEKSIVEPDDWEDAADAPKLDNSDKIEEINGGLRHHEEDGAACKKYSRDFLLTLKDQCADLPAGFDIAYDMVEALMGSKASISKSVEHNPPPSPGRVINRPIAMSRPDFRGAGMVDDDRWFKSPVPFPFNQDHHVDVGQGGNTVGFRLGQGGTHGNMRNLRGQIPGQYIVGLQSGPLLPLESYGGIQCNGPDADRWQRASGFQKGLIPSPQSPMQVIHKAANKYEVGKVTDAEAAKQRQLKAILNKLTPQNFDRLFEQVKEVNIDNAVTLTGVISQIFDKALMEPTFCEMYANFCHDLAGELPDFVEDNEKITFKRLLLNKCQEEFERGEREQAEADKVEGDGKVKQSAVEREEKRVQARRRMLGNIRLIGELYKKRMLTERIMHECIIKLLGQYPNPEEEDIEALCKLMSTIGEMIDHPKAKEHMDVYFETMTNLSTNMKLSSRVRFMLKDSIDLRKNKWQQRRKVDGPKKIEEVHRDAAQERQQVNRLARSSSISSSARRGQPSDFGPRASIMFSPPTRAERSESHYRRPGRPGNSVYQRVSSGGVGKGGGGTGLPPASANSQSSTNRSFKKSNGQWAQSRVTVTSANSESSAVHNGARAQPSLQGASNALFTDASAKSTDMHNQRSHQTASSAPTSASASGTSESTAPTTPVRADASKGVSLQSGSFSPNIVSGMQIPARTSSAPPNLHEQKCDQARHDSFRSDPLLPTSSISNRQQPREDVEQSKSTVPHPPSSDKRGVRAQASAYSGATSAKNSSTPLSAASMAIPFHQSRVVQVGKVTDTEAAKLRQLKAILNKLTPQNFDRLFEQVKEVNIDNAVTLTGVISQIFDKALMEPQMYANFCHHLAGELPDFVEDNEKITFKRLLLNKCQEEFERGEREQAEADKVDGDGKVKQSAVEREEKRVQARRRMLGNIRLIGELYKKRMLTERIMHECIIKLLGQYPNPEEEDIEALCKLMSTIGEMIDHPKAKEHMDVYFETMTNLSTNMKLSSRVRFMLKDSIDLRKNKWQQRRKVDGPKKIEEVHRDAAQERQQVNRLARSSSISSSSRRGQPSDFGPRASIMFSPPTTPQGAFRGGPPQLRGFGTQGIRFEDRHPYENRTLSVPLSHRPVDDNVITLGSQGGLARGMSMRGPAILSGAPLADVSTGPGESRRIRSGPNGYSSATEWMPNNSRQEPMTRNVQQRFMRSPAYDHSNSQEHGVYYGDRDLNNADRSFDRSMAGSAATHVKSSATPVVSSGKVWPEERLRDMSMAAIREFYSVRDEKEVALCIRDLNSPSFYPSMISIWVNDSLERKDRDRDLLARLLVNLTKSRDGMLTSVQLTEGIELVLATLEDTVTDAPKAAEFLGRIIARTIMEKVISLREIGRLIQQGGEYPGRLLQIGLGYEVLQSAFHMIRSDKGESTLNEICMSSNLRLEDFRPIN